MTVTSYAAPTAPAIQSAELRQRVNRTLQPIAKPPIDLYEYVKITPRLRAGVRTRIIGWLG